MADGKLTPDDEARALCKTVRRILVTEHEEKLAAHVERLLAVVATLETEIDYYRRLLGESHARETALEKRGKPQ
jgi:hypothetical protein